MTNSVDFETLLEALPLHRLRLELRGGALNVVDLYYSGTRADDAYTAAVNCINKPACDLPRIISFTDDYGTSVSFPPYLIQTATLLDMRQKARIDKAREALFDVGSSV